MKSTTNMMKYKPRIDKGKRHGQKCMICHVPIHIDIKRFLVRIARRYEDVINLAICPICFNKFNEEMSIKEMEIWTMEYAAKQL